MQSTELSALIQQLQSTQAESQTIELKTAAVDCPKRLYDTLSAFSNQDDGGILIFGIDEHDGFTIKGVYDVQDLQKKVTEQCKQMEPSVRPLFTICQIDGKSVVSAEIPGVDISLRPVFYKGVGRIKSSYIRVGESDEPMSEYEIYSYEAFRKRIRDDLRTVDNQAFFIPDQSKIQAYLTAVKTDRSNLSKHVSDQQLFELMSITVSGKPTLAGLMTFSVYPQAVFPQLCITAVCLPGTEMGISGSDGERFIDNRRITGPIPDMLEEAVEFVRRNSRTKTIIDENGHRIDKPEYPMKAVREAILNALIHRDYSIYSENTPIRIEMYRDKMEIINCVGLYGRITINALGKVRPVTRNAALSNMLELLKITENRYSGIPTMRKECANANLPAPLFSVVHGEFKVVFRNGLYEYSITSISLLEFCQIPRTRDEITAFVGKSRNYVISHVISPLLKSGELKMTNPDKPKSPTQKYFRPSNT